MARIVYALRVKSRVFTPWRTVPRQCDLTKAHYRQSTFGFPGPVCCADSRETMSTLEISLQTVEVNAGHHHVCTMCEKLNFPTWPAVLGRCGQTKAHYTQSTFGSPGPVCAEGRETMSATLETTQELNSFSMKNIGAIHGNSGHGIEQNRGKAA